MSEQTPPDEKEGYGDMTRAWFDAGSEVADYEAGRAAERRRLVLAIVGAVLVLGGVVALVLWLV